MRKHLVKYLALDGIFEGGRMFVGATSIAYLITQGVSLRQIALLKSIQAVTLLMGEVPTGIIADHYGRRTSLLGGLLISIVGFIAYFIAGGFKGGTFTILVMAEICTALGLCFWSGAFEAFSIDQGKLLKTSGNLDAFFHTNQTVNKVTVLFSGLMGGWIGSQGLGFPYLAAAASFVVAAVLLFYTNEETASNREATSSRFSLRMQLTSMRDVLCAPGIRFWLLAIVFVQFSIQPILHYWQPFLLEMDNTITPIRLGWIFSGYCAASAGCSWIYARLAQRPVFRKSGATGGLFITFCLLYILLGRTHQIIYAALIFFALQGVLGVARTSLAVRINSLLPSTNRATSLSAVSLISRLGMIAALWSISTAGADGPHSITHLFQGFAVVSLFLTAGLSIFFVCVGLQPKFAQAAVLSGVLGLQVWASVSSTVTYPFSPYRMFSKNWKNGGIMDQVRYEDDHERIYPPWDLLKIPFFQANQLSFVTFLDSAPGEQKQALCAQLFKSLPRSKEIKVLGSEVQFERSPTGTMISQEQKKEVIYVCQR